MNMNTDLKVSHAAMSTPRSFWISQKQTLDRLVLLPTPFTPTNVIVYGIRCCEDATGGVDFILIASNRSVDVLGVRILVREADSAVRTALLVAEIRMRSRAQGHQEKVVYSGSLPISFRRGLLLRPRISFQRSPSPRSSS